jgi:hypothetical protein
LLSGNWQRCSVEDRLEHAGLVIKRHDDPVRHPYLAVPGDVYDVGKGELQVFVYASEKDRERDSAKLDSATAAPAGTATQWSKKPTLILSNNLLAILLSDNETQIERVELAITAGLPRP